MPQCGLAPGFISIAAAELITHFDQVRAVKMRVGALPQHPNNVLKYSLTWSTEGLINEYGNPCQAITDGRMTEVAPLEGLEEIEIDGTLYEAFNTSGGLGSLAETHGARTESMNYKTIRYPGHCEQMRLLMNDLKLNHDRKTLKHILENAVPQTLQDVVIVYAAVTGTQDGQLREENYVNKIYPQVIAGRLWSAIQVTTAAGITAVVDLVLEKKGKYQGFVAQEQFRLTDILANRFGRYYAAGGTKDRLGRGRRRRQGRSPASQEGGQFVSKVDINAVLNRLGLGAANPGAWSGAHGWSKSTEVALVNVRNPADGSLLAQVRPANARRLRGGHGRGGRRRRPPGARCPRPSAARPCGCWARHCAPTRTTWARWCRSRTARSSPRAWARCRR